MVAVTPSIFVMVESKVSDETFRRSLRGAPRFLALRLSYEDALSVFMFESIGLSGSGHMPPENWSGTWMTRLSASSSRRYATDPMRVGSTCESHGARGPEKTPRKEVIHPHLPVGIPCYDFTPVTDHSLVSALPKVRLPTSGLTDSHGVTGGVYKARERIHRSVLISDY